MTNATYAAGHTALLIVDPYNDFMSEGGKLYNAIKPTADESGLFDNLRKIIPAFRSAGVQVFIVPHHRSRPDDFAGWQHVNMFQKTGIPTQAFAEGTWGGEFNAEFGPREGDGSSKNTGRRADSRTPIWMHSSSSTAFRRSFWSAWLPTAASSPPRDSAWRSATTSRWCPMRLPRSALMV